MDEVTDPVDRKAGDRAGRTSRRRTDRTGKGRAEAADSAARAGKAVQVGEDVNELGMIALSALLTQQHSTLRQAELALAALSETYRSTRMHQSAGDLLKVVSGDQAVRQQFELLQYGAQHEVLGMGEAGYVVSGPGESLAEAQAMDRGVAYRVVIERRAFDTPGMHELLRADLSRGQRCRIAEQVPTKLLIVDRSLAMLPLCDQSTEFADQTSSELGHDHAGPDETRSYDTGPGDIDTNPEPAALVVRAPALIRALTGLFESVWERAVPVRAAGADLVLDEASAEPTVLDLHILSQLLAGATDATIAKQLGLGLRTVQRHVARLMDLARVTTRLQLGWIAARRGWLDSAEPPQTEPAEAEPTEAEPTEVDAAETVPGETVPGETEPGGSGGLTEAED